MENQSSSDAGKEVVASQAGNSQLVNSQDANPVGANPVENKPLEALPQEEEQIDIELFKKVKLRVGQVVSAEMVPKSKKMLKLQVHLGAQLGTRQILSGIAQFYTPEQMVGKKIIVVANLKKAMLMGLESQGMLLAASDEGGTKLSIVDPGADMEPGAEVR